MKRTTTKADHRLARRIVALLEEARRLDPAAVERLFARRVLCNQRLAAHPTIQVGGPTKRPGLGVVGLLNGLCGLQDRGLMRGHGLVCSIHDDETGRLTGFGLTEGRRPAR